MRTRPEVSVTAPPYDVIDPEHRDRLAAADPHNSVRLILPEGDDPYRGAATLLETWVADGTLVIAGTGNNLRAYRTPSPWTNLGGGIAGGLGEPTLTGVGSLTAGNTVTFRASNAAPNSLGVFILGSSAVNVSIFGGTLVPSLDATLVVPIDGLGRWSLGFPWPAGYAPGTGFWWQLAVLDGSSPSGLAASDGLRSIAP